LCIRLAKLEEVAEWASNLENDDGSIPSHAWEPLQQAIAALED
jgi:hypothetical protein